MATNIPTDAPKTGYSPQSYADLFSTVTGETFVFIVFFMVVFVALLIYIFFVKYVKGDKMK